MTTTTSLFPVLAADPPPGTDPYGTLRFVLTMAVVFAIFYFLFIRPQQKQEKERRAMLEAIKKKDRVLTSGGLLGIVADLRDDEVTLRISENPDVKVRVRRSAVVEVLREPAETAAK